MNYKVLGIKLHKRCNKHRPDCQVALKHRPLRHLAIIYYQNSENPAQHLIGVTES